MKGRGKAVIAVLIVVALFGVYTVLKNNNILFVKNVKESVLITSNEVILPNAPKTSVGTNVPFVTLPTDELANVSKPKIVFEVMAWNSQIGLMLSNGGVNTTKGSLMEKHNINLMINRQDDCVQMCTDLLTFAKSYKENPQTAQGTAMFAVMGDAAASMLSGLNNELSKLGDEFKAKIFFSCGRSLGEDAFLASPKIKENPQNAKGMLVATVIRDGDWNIVIKWCADNGIRVNTDEKTYDQDAVNFVNAATYLDAAEKYINGYSEERVVVKYDEANKKTTRTKDKKTVTVDGVSTWTPADVNVAERKGGLIRIASTAEYAAQMPNVVISFDKYLKDNSKDIEEFILAVTEANDQVKTYDKSLVKAGEISAKVYNEKTGDYWVRYFKGVQQTDRTCMLVTLGGSGVHNLSDNMAIFGATPNSTNVYASVYKVFGDIVSKYYPELVPTYPKIDEVLDVSYMIGASSRADKSTTIVAETQSYTTNGSIKETVSKRSYNIQFETGSANLTHEAVNTMEDLYDQLIVASALSIDVFGHTDNTGNSESNITLSQQRANVIKIWLQNKSRNSFPDERFAEVKGKGQTEPIADNNTTDGKSKNRRVEIILGK